MIYGVDSCSWCHYLTRFGESICRRCGHQGRLPQSLCYCPACAPIKAAAERAGHLPPQFDILAGLTMPGYH